MLESIPYTRLYVYCGLSLTMGFLFWTLSSMSYLTCMEGFSALTATMVLFVAVQIYWVRRAFPVKWLLNPVVLCSFLTFLLSYGFSNLQHMLPDAQPESIGKDSEITVFMVKHVFLALLGAVALFLGFWSTTSSSRIRTRLTGWVQRNFISTQRNVGESKIMILLSVSMAARLILIGNGAFGYAVDIERIQELSSYTQVLSNLSSLGKLALAITALNWFAHRRTRFTFLLFLFALSTEVVFGLMTGFKSAILIPFIVIGICQYLVIGSIGWGWVLSVMVSLPIAYVVIEPFRATVRESPVYTYTSVTSILGAFMSPGEEQAIETEDEISIFQKALMRSSLTWIGSYGIEYADSYNELPEGSPSFLGDILAAPVYALVPRALWKEKPLANLGEWYTKVVLGFDMESSTAMGPLCYLYFAGRYLAVFVAFFVLGSIHRLLSSLLDHSAYTIPALLYAFCLQPLAMIDSSVNAIPIVFIREFPLYLLLLILISERRSHVGYGVRE